MRKKVKIRKVMQFRAEDLKTLQEQRTELVQRMKDLSNTAETEKRAFSEDEEKEFDELEGKVKDLDKTIERVERARDLQLNVISKEQREKLDKG